MTQRPSSTTRHKRPSRRHKRPSRFAVAFGRLSGLARHRSLRTRDMVLSLVVVFDFAVAYPLLEVLGRHPEFFTAHGAPWSDLVGLAVGVTLVAPLALAGLVRLAFAVHHVVGFVVHVAVLVALLVVLLLGLTPPLESPLSAGEWLLVAMAALGSAGVVVAFYASHWLRSFVRAGVIAPVGFAGLFLLASPARSLVLPADAGDDAPQARIDNPVPIVMFVVDELPLATLLDGDGGGVDAERFPNFARLAADATWFTNTTTNHAYTSQAMPALLSGRRVTEDVEPTVEQHPVNLFTLLAERYRPWTSEHLTRLCPPRVCEEVTGDTSVERWRQLALDLGVVGLHTTVPEAVSAGLPPIDHAWAGFAGAGTAEQERDFEDFLASLDDARGPSLHYFHHPRPHFPWRQLPSEQTYTTSDETPGLVPTERGLYWSNEDWPAVHGWQRHLFQVGSVDSQLGRLLDRLKETGLYEEALVVVTSDHGVAFQPGESMRHVTRPNMAEVAYVPLFVKRPSDTVGRRVDRPAQLVDVIPTILDVVDAKTEHAFDGYSLFGAEARAPSADRRLRLVESYGRTRAVGATPDDVVDRVVEREQLFGDGGWEPVWRVGPRPELLGRRVDQLDDAVDDSARVRLDDPGQFRDVDPDGERIPSALVTGTLVAQEAIDGPVDIAVVVNERVVATGRTFAQDGRRAEVSVLAPPEAFQPGANDVDVLALRPERRDDGRDQEGSSTTS